MSFQRTDCLNWNLIGDGPLTDLLEEVERANGDTPVTFFEFTTAAAMLAFTREPADLLLLETGLGGTLGPPMCWIRLWQP